MPWRAGAATAETGSALFFRRIPENFSPNPAAPPEAPRFRRGFGVFYDYACLQAPCPDQPAGRCFPGAAHGAGAGIRIRS